MHTPLINEIRVYKSLRERLLEDFPHTDDETLADTLEGITSLYEMIAQIIRSALVDQALVSGLKMRVDEMKIRLDRLQTRAGKKRQLALDAMAEAGIRKLTEADFTVSMRTGSSSLIVTSEDNIPRQYMVPQPPKLDRQGLLAVLKSGQVIEGAVLSNPQPTISVRTK